MMQVVCIGNRGSDLPESVLGRTANSGRARFQLTVGSAYAVYAMAIRKGNLGLLVLADHARPAWCHVELFEFADAALPVGWSFTTRDEEVFGISALWGYRSMIQKPSHNDDLMERKRSAWGDFLSDNEWATREGPDQDKMRMLNGMFQSGRTFLRPPDMGTNASAGESL
ncbi:hypothetical protein M2302_004296 [Micromonospora sp. A200]|uniref:hypothetical protein n=1 Tax=Micromonospora sp. A200 TaxID=2940568 RepID=UPI0024739882|nr:hypothetical protein [Micromonospora sp. A200]MDH6464099.1 hypothetical protein [Micromonospora sp. A200]